MADKKPKSGVIGFWGHRNPAEHLGIIGLKVPAPETPLEAITRGDANMTTRHDWTEARKQYEAYLKDRMQDRGATKMLGAFADSKQGKALAPTAEARAKMIEALRKPHEKLWRETHKG